MKRLPKLISLIILVPWLFWTCPDIVMGAVPDQKRVDSVEVQLDVDGKIYEGLQERIEFSIGRVGEKILLSQPLSLLKQNENNLKMAMFNIFSKVLTGFKVDSIDLLLGTHTKILIRLLPQPPLISKIDVRLSVQGIAPQLGAFVEEIGDRTESELDKIFTGLPVASITWADSIFTMVINYTVEREFPGFKTMFSIKSGETVELNLQLIPNGRIVNDVSVHYNSDTIPIWAVRHKLVNEEQKFRILKGVPVEFLLHYQSDIERLLTKEFDNFDNLKYLGMNVDLRVKPSDITDIDLQIDSRTLRANLLAKIYLGDENYNYLEGHLGYCFSDYEIYTTVILGDSPGERSRVGLRLPISTNFYGGFEHEIENHLQTIDFHYTFERGDYLSLKVGIGEATSEASIGIRLNKHLDLEMIGREDEYGIQFNFNFW